MKELEKKELVNLNGGWVTEVLGYGQNEYGRYMYWYDSEVGGYVGCYWELIV